MPCRPPLAAALIAGAQTAPAERLLAQSATPRAELPILSSRGGRPLLTLADGSFTAQPVLRLDLDFGGCFGQRV